MIPGTGNSVLFHALVYLPIKILTYRSKLDSHLGKVGSCLVQLILEDGHFVLAEKTYPPTTGCTGAAFFELSTAANPCTSVVSDSKSELVVCLPAGNELKLAT